MTAAQRHGESALHACRYGVFHYRLTKAKFSRTALWRDHSPMSWVLTRFTHKAWLIPAAWLISRRVAEAAGPWDERLSLNDDAEYFCRVVLASGHVHFDEQATCYYRSTGYGQLSRTRSERALESLLLSLALCIRHLQSVEVSERTRRGNDSATSCAIMPPIDAPTRCADLMPSTSIRPTVSLAISISL